MKKQIFLFTISLIIAFGGIASTPVRAIAEGETSITETSEVLPPEVSSEEAPTPAGVVVLPTELTGGTIEASVTSGEVGDVIILYPHNDIFYVLEGISVNDVTLLPDSEGVYSFALIEGENVVTVSFGVNQEMIQKFLTIYEQLKNGDLASVFSFENIMIFVNWLLNAAIGFGLVVILRKYKRFKTITSSELKDEVGRVVPQATTASLENLINTIIRPVLTKLESVEEANKVFAKCFALSQENTPEARLAIVDLLSGLRLSDAEITKAVSDFIENEMARAQAKIAEQAQAIADLKAANEKAKAESRLEQTTTISQRAIE